MENLQFIGSIITLIGSVFLLLGALGVLRMPDVYNRMQTGTKATTLGTILFLTGMAFVNPSWTGKIVLLIGFIIYTNPISSHALARASHYFGIPLSDKTVKDCLKDDEKVTEKEAS